MKILTFGNIPVWAGGKNPGGLANVIYQLAYHMNEVDPNVHNILVATDVSGKGFIKDKLRVVGWDKRDLLLYAAKNPATSFRYFIYLLVCKYKYGNTNINIVGRFFKGIHLRRNIDIEKPDVIHLHEANSIVYFYIIPKNLKIITTLHGKIGGDPHIYKSKEYEKFEKEVFSSRRLSRLYCVTNKILEDFKKVYNTIVPSTAVILNSYDANVFHYVAEKPHAKITLISIGSICPNKGQLRVLEAIKESGKDIRYICIGPEHPEFKGYISDFATNNGLDFVYAGSVAPDEIRAYLSESDYMILPSSTEGFGLVFLESIACGVPVILPKELPICNEKGIIKPNINSVLLDDCSKNAILKILGDIENRKFERHIVSQSIEGCSWNNIAKQYVDNIYQIVDL